MDRGGTSGKTLRRRGQAADAWSRGRGSDMAMPDPAGRRLCLFSYYAGLLGEHATPQLSPSLSLQPAATPSLRLVHSPPEAGVDGGTQAGS